MALLWMLNDGDCRYEVRSAGASRRLYTNGVLHSQFNLKSGNSRSIWDLMVAPALMLPKLDAALVLGVGGGAAIRTLENMAPKVNICGVDNNAVHLEVARQYFELNSKRIQLCHEDAGRWLQGSDSQRFDLIVDDLYSDTGGEAERAFELSEAWLKSLVTRCSDSAVIVVNAVSSVDQKIFKRFLSQPNQGFRSFFRASMPGYSNLILIAYRGVPAVDTHRLRKSIENQPLLNSLRFELRSLGKIQ